METIDLDDPCEVARICPPGLMDVPLSEIPMPLRCQEVLAQQKISNLRQLQRRCQNTFPRWARFGPASARDLAEALRLFILSRATDASVFVNTLAEEDDSFSAMVPAKTLLEELDRFVATLSESRRTVFDERVMGQKTLKEVGDLLDLSSQRVSQIEDSVRVQLAKQPWVKDLGERLLALLSGRSEPLFLDLVEVDNPWFSGWSSRSRELARLMCFLQLELTVMLLQGREVVSQISQNRFDRVLENILRFLAKKVGEAWSRESVESCIEGELRSKGAPELAGYVKELLHPALHYSLPRGGRPGFLCSVGSGINELIMAIIENSEQPLHYAQVASALSVRLGEKFKARNIEARLSNLPGLLGFGRGRYGSESHYPLSAEAEAEVAEMVADIMAAAPERLWHVDELLKAMVALGEDLPGDLDRYLLNILLSRSQEFRNMSRMTWSLKAAQQLDARVMIAITEACTEILVESGRPMHLREIKEKMGRQRGTGDFFFLRPTERMSRVAPGTWGLIDRDFGLTANERAIFLEGLQSALEKRGVSLHRSELAQHRGAGADCASRPTEFMLMGLVQSDRRFRVHPGKLIALAAWSGPRRHTVSSAVGQCAGAGRTEVNMAEFVTEVEAVMGRTVARAEVVRTLVNLGWRQQGVTETFVVD